MVEEADRSFVTHAAHELRASLGGISSAVEALEHGAKEDPQERDTFLGGLGEEVGALTRAVEGLLVLARAQSDPRELLLEQVELAPLVEAV